VVILYNMISGMFHIKLNSSEENKDSGFFALMTSGASIICLEDEEYVVPKEAVDRLNKKKIIYELVTDKKVVDIKGESDQNAAEVKI